MAISAKISERCQGVCELCNELAADHEYLVSPKTDEVPANQVALCNVCLDAIAANDTSDYWRFLEGSIWSPIPSVQALSCRILSTCQSDEWARNILDAVELDEDVTQWALSSLEVAAVHKDAFGNKLENGDTIVLTQGLNVKGTSFMAAKGTIVRKIKLVHDNPEQIEGKINDQLIVILTKFVKKG